MEYKKRIIDNELDLKLEAFGATLIVGPKGCGKTTSAKQKAKSYVEFQDEEQRENLLAVAEAAPSKLLIGDKPRLFDEWQDAPKLWGAIRKSVDDLGENGLYILTGSSSKEVDTPHTGTLRISKLKMYPMSLYESEESTAVYRSLNFLIIPKILTAVFPNFLSTDSFLPSAAAVGRIACRIRLTAQNWKSPKIYTDKPIPQISATSTRPSAILVGRRRYCAPTAAISARLPRAIQFSET